MTILVTGSTGKIGSQVVQRLADRGAKVRAFARDAAKLKLPAGVEPVQGDMTDVASVRTALNGSDTLFLINAVVPDETTQALLMLDLAREAGIQRIVYFSVFNSAVFDDVPHFAGKHLMEQVIDAHALPATVLRPAYFMQNDLMFRDALKAGIYPQPVGGMGVAMVDARDIADAAASELLRREQSPHPLPRNTIELVGPDTLTGADVAAIWASVLQQEVRYGGDDLAAFEAQAAAMMPGWLARDLRTMFRAFHQFGMVPGSHSRTTLEALLEHPLRSYRAFAEETAASW
ncbi:MAG: NmrA family NAD(P)-binding protein [Acetobacteraceae bacterium]|nr:NmrA family NAD(P)-binding protein [Acetobacteraceae bacterium]